MRCSASTGLFLITAIYLGHVPASLAQPAAPERMSPATPPGAPTPATRPPGLGAPPTAVEATRKTTAIKGPKAKAARLSREAIEAWNAYEYVNALDKLNRAYKLYPDHNLLFNIGLVNQSLGRYVVALEAFERFLKRAQGPAYETAIQKARDRLQALSKKTAIVVVRVFHRGALVTLDRQDLGKGPLTVHQRVMPGIHLLVVSQRGFVTRRARFGISAGRTRTLSVQLTRLPPNIIRTKLGRRFPRWLPWTILGAGALVAAIGAPVMWKAKEDLESLDRQIQDASDASGGHPVSLTAKMKDLRTRAGVAFGFSVAFYTIGALGTVSGVVLAILNRPRALSPETPKAPSNPSSGGDRRVMVLPYFGPHGGGAAVTFTW